MPEENDTAIVSISIASGICERGGRAGDGASAWNDSSASGQTARDGRSESADAGTMAALVGGGVHGDGVLAIGDGTLGGAGGEEHVAAVVAGMFSKSDGTRENDGPAALHPASNERFRHSRNMRFAVLPQKMPVDLGGETLIGSALGGRECRF